MGRTAGLGAAAPRADAHAANTAELHANADPANAEEVRGHEGRRAERCAFEQEIEEVRKKGGSRAGDDD